MPRTPLVTLHCIALHNRTIPATQPCWWPPGAQISASNIAGDTPLHFAAGNGNVALADLLISRVREIGSEKPHRMDAAALGGSTG